MELFGFEIRRKKEDQSLPSFAPETNDDGAMVVTAGGSYGTYVDLDGTVRTEAELVSKYREMAQQPEIDSAIDDITNESIVKDENQKTVEIVLDELNIPANLKKAISSEFQNILYLLDFGVYSYDIFRRWYTDGRLYYHIIIDEKNVEEGIKELRYVDPRKIRKIREVSRRKFKNDSNTILQKTEAEYYIYNDKGFQSRAGAQAAIGTTNGLRIAKDSIVYVPSGLTDRDGTMVLSHLHKAIKPLNQLRAMEDSTLIYRISRAPERLIFYIDVGNLPKIKAEQHLRDMMTRYKNRLVYNAENGEIKDDRKFMTMTENFWLPRREGGRGTEITTLPAGQNLGELEDVRYFQKRLFNSLNVPISRLEPETTFNLGRAAEISRDEVKFAKFIERLRQRFNILFIEALEKQLIMKRIITAEDWPVISKAINFRYCKDNYYSEIKDLEIFGERMNRLRDVSEFAGKYFSHTWIRKNILKQTEDEIEENDAQIGQEQLIPQYNPEILNQEELQKPSKKPKG